MLKTKNENVNQLFTQKYYRKCILTLYIFFFHKSMYLYNFDKINESGET